MTDLAIRPEWIRHWPSPGRMMQRTERSVTVVGIVSDGSRYSITRKPAPRVREAEAPSAPRVTAEVLPPIELPEPQLAQGSRPALKVAELAGPRVLSVRVEFGDVELTIEHRGDEVSLVIPGALRLRAPRSQAMALVAALMKRP